jgi:hypothetical protein
MTFDIVDIILLIVSAGLLVAFQLVDVSLLPLLTAHEAVALVGLQHELVVAVVPAPGVPGPDLLRE